jgi:RNA polymerase sigma factor (TIGR02999 family)
MEKATTGEISPLQRSDLSRLLDDLREGKQGSFDRAFEIVYKELRRLAQQQLGSEKPGHTLLPTALVHEAYIKLVGSPAKEWHGRAHFFGVAARAMRQVLVEHARKRLAGKRGGGCERTVLAEWHAVSEMDPEELLALDAALDRLEKVDGRLREVVECRFYLGLDEEEVARLLGVSTRTVERNWRVARAWLYKEIYPSKAG